MRLDTKLLAAFCAVALPLSWAVTVSARKAVHAVLVAELSSAAAAGVPEALGSLRIGLNTPDGRALKTYIAGCLQGFRASYAAAYGPAGEPAGHTDPAAQAPLESGLQEELSLARAPVARERSIGAALVLEYGVPVRSPGDLYLGALLLRFPLSRVLATERLIARRVLAFSGTFVAAALILLWVLTRRMIAELRHKEAKLAQSEKLSLVGQLAAGIAHEINNPLGGILIYSSLMMEDLPEQDPKRQDLARIVQETIRCKDIVKSLLEFARQTAPKFEPTDINRAIIDGLFFLENQHEGTAPRT